MATKTLGVGTGGNTRNYTTLAAYSSYVNALAFTAPEILEVYNDGVVIDTTAVTLNGWTGGSTTNTLTIRAATGQSWRDHANVATNPFRYNEAVGAALRSTAVNAIDYTFGSNVIIQNLQIQAQADTQSHTGTAIYMGLNGKFQNCILDSWSGSTLSTVATGVWLENCLLYGRGAGHNITLQHASFVILNTTVVGVNIAGTRGIRCPYNVSPGPIAKDTVFYGFPIDVEQTADVSSTNNATSLAVFGGTNWGASAQVNITAADFISVTAGSEDFRPSPTSKLLNTGANTGITPDAAGVARPQGAAYDIGAVERAVAATTINTGFGNAVASGANAVVLGALSISTKVGNAIASGAAASVINLVPGVIITATPGNAVASGSSASVGTYIQTDVISNNTGTILANTAVVWTWTPLGRIGSMVSLLPTDGSGVTDANGRLAPNILLNPGRLDVAVRNSNATTDDVFYQAF